MLEITLSYVVIGLLTGALSGLLGIGGGSIVVPALSIAFMRQNFDENLAIHMAASTSFAIILLTSQTSLRNHHKKASIDASIVKDLLPGLIIGVTLGHFICNYLSGYVLKHIFAVFLLFIGIRILGFELPRTQKPALPGRLGMTISGLIIGGKSGLLGIGGGTLTIPFLTHFQVSMRKAIGISALVSFSIALTGALVNLVEPSHTGQSWSTGYIYWPAVLTVAIPSILAAKLGVIISHKLPVNMLRKIFAILLLLTATELLLR